MKVFVAGATGQTGCRIVQDLVRRDIPVKALVRDLETAKEILPPEAELVMGDVLNSQGLYAAIEDSTVLLCATGAKPSFDFTGPYQVDYVGTKNLVDVAKQKGIDRFILVSSLCVSKFFHPLNLFWLILFWKKQAEGYIQKSGLNYTIVRPGGLKNDDNQFPIVMESADRLFEGSIPRTKVAQVSVEAIFQPAACNKIVEIITEAEAPEKSWEELFISVS
ncbi:MULTISPECIES: NAD(P)H-binding protein [Okeania]|uniref:NAD-dependent epimerase/dehydratase family protein n=1 Tax=Okeania hirsuta TaxID=1458930 RepID=A0A3N6MRR9_9CYAN|nr:MULTISPECIES: NAD(P)H-binding protein [Okeania]NEP46553.1 NAD(P)H-binding protein [Okeania sp. SIO2H7]NET13342.1 NAD(P)H-binding protein [Okeania sp. SIO1H6]NEP75159.1 NAD(P)H-binding protein [Okeania sp. SIO2G5]NEP94812.1 NAD(P)H-binding protein [Okeania sp. SIO2F5]NEQ92508.1 NAD(P)H-binding protein [Okeania sp. SIO2G4]